VWHRPRYPGRMRLLAELDLDEVRGCGCVFTATELDNAVEAARRGVSTALREGGRVVAHVVPAGPDGEPSCG
jgi:hypothetical protein